MSRPTKPNERQLAVLRWIGDGCPPRDWPDQSHKLTARVLEGRGLVQVSDHAGLRRHPVLMRMLVPSGPTSSLCGAC
ncbi:hypothetical protein CEDDRAFT_04406, partial [Frankia sp. CeD]